MLDAISGTITGGVGSDNVIVLTGVLEAGTYTVKYQNTDGSLTKIGTLTVGSSSVVEPTYENLIPSAKSFADTTAVFNEVGYQNGTYLSSASPFYGSQDAETVCTGLIPASTSSIFYIKGVEFNSAKAHCRLGLFKSRDGVAACYGAWAVSNASTYMTIETLGTQYYKVTLNQEYLDADAAMKNMQYFAFSAVGSGENLIVATTEIE